MNQPLISVIMNCYNGQTYLHDSIDSVLAQTYVNWEIVFWDNQSRDRSAEIVQSYADERITYHYAPRHTPLYEARNLAIDKASGEFFAFLDVDDWWEADKLEQQIELFGDPEVGIACSNYWIYDEQKHRRRLFREKAKPLIETAYDLENVLANYYVGMLTMVVRRSALETLSKRFDPRFNIIGDFDLSVRMCVRYKIAVINKPLATYRTHSTNLSSLQSDGTVKELFLWRNEIKSLPEVKNSSGFGVFLRHLHYQSAVVYANAKQWQSTFALLPRLATIREKVLVIIRLLLPRRVVTMISMCKLWVLR